MGLVSSLWYSLMLNVASTAPARQGPTPAEILNTSIGTSTGAREGSQEPSTTRSSEGAIADSPSAILARLSEARRRDFHTNRRILVVDDVRDSAVRVTTDLRELYGTVEYETDSLRVVDKIKEAAANGSPYDAIVLDLYMPGKTGLEVLRELGDNSPGVVIHSGSMMSPSIANLEVQIGSYVSGEGKRLFEIYDRSQQAAGLPTVAIQSHFKLGTLEGLVDKLDTVMLIREFASDSTHKFLQIFKPELQEIHFSNEVVHRIAEDVQNFVAVMRPVADALLGSTEFVNSRYWQVNAKNLTETFNAIESTRFSTLAGENPAITSANLHTLVNKLAKLRPPSPDMLDDLNDCGRVSEEVRRWSTAWESTIASVNGRYLSFCQYQKGELDVGGFMSRLLPEADIWLPNSIENGYEVVDWREPERHIDPVISDPDRLIRTFLTSLVEAFKRRLNTSPEPEPQINVNLRHEEDQAEDHFPENVIRRSAAINCGDHWVVALGDHTGRSLDEDYGHLVPAAIALERAELAFLEIENGQDDFGGVSLYIKVSELRGNYKAELDRIRAQSEKKEDGSWIYTSSRKENITYPVREDLGSNGDIVIIGCGPDQITSRSKPMLYRDTEGRLIWADEGLHHSHYYSSGLIHEIEVEWLARRGEREKSRAIRFNTDMIQDIYWDGLRALGDRSGRIVLDLKPEELPMHWGYQLLKELGIPKEKIEADKGAFLSRA